MFTRGWLNNCPILITIAALGVGKVDDFVVNRVRQELHLLVHDLVEGDVFALEVSEYESLVTVHPRDELEFHHYLEQYDLEDVIVWEAFGGIEDLEVVLAPLLQTVDALEDHRVVADNGPDYLVLEVVLVVVHVDQVKMEALFVVEQYQSRHALILDVGDKALLLRLESMHPCADSPDRGGGYQIDIRVLRIRTIIERTVQGYLWFDHFFKIFFALHG